MINFQTKKSRKYNYYPITWQDWIWPIILPIDIFIIILFDIMNIILNYFMMIK